MEKKLAPEQVAEAKAMGFLRNRGTDRFSGRAVTAGGVYTAEQLRRIADCAERYGNGNVAMTSRLSAEIVGIPFERIEEAKAFLSGDDSGIAFGGTGPKVRPVTACKGTTCVFGQGDTQALAAEIHRRYYLGWSAVKLPHKFKIAVGGCPNSCIKPSLNDIGIEAVRRRGETSYKIFAGGTWGRTTRVGDLLDRTVTEQELFPLLDRILAWYRDNAAAGERFGAAIDRLGLASLNASVQKDRHL